MSVSEYLDYTKLLSGSLFKFSSAGAMDYIAKLLSLLGLVAICSACAFKDTETSSSQLAGVKESNGRNMYSPTIYGDINAQQQWIAGIEALEKQCRTTGRYCREAQVARQSLNENTRGMTRPAR